MVGVVSRRHITPSVDLDTIPNQQPPMSDANSCASCTSSSITADCSVDAVMRKSPTAQAVLDRFGIDTCCGGSASLREAALHAHLDPALVLEAITAPQPVAVVAPRTLPQATSCGCGCR